MIAFGNIPLGAVLPIPFATYGKTNGESITLTGLATTDIEVYKGTSITQRASDAGYALIDTDGIDIDGTTGIHGFSIDTGDNTDAGFFVAGSFYYVVVSAVTVDSQTVNFIAATFRIVAAESVAGVVEVDLTHINGAATTATLDTIKTETASIQSDTNDIQTRLPAALVSGRIDASVGAVAANAITATAIASDAITAAKIADGAIDAATFAAGAIDATAIAADAIGSSELAATAVAEIADAIWDEARAGHATLGTYGESFAVIITGSAIAGTLSTTAMTTDLTEATDDHYNGRTIIWTSGVLLGQATNITDYTGATKLLTYTAVTEAPTAGDDFIIV